MKTVFTNGCFDILHRAHFELLKHCKSLGYVIVGLNSDQSVKMNKGESRPWNSVKDRKFMLESCKYVDEVVVFNEETPQKLIEKIRPDIIVKGGDYTAESVIGNEISDVHIFEYLDGYSTSSILGEKC